VLADGRTVTVTSTALLGRDPTARAGEAPGALVGVDDPGRSVSRTHLEVGVDTTGAWVVDRRSTNGAVVTLPDGQQILCVPERRVRLVAGASVRFGSQTLTLAAVAPARPTAQEVPR
jgi:pSer/pThr/pTyr-binding forkhead associated (FHA) protein